jgi:transcriptional regulator with XRE-family HTH domain
MAKKGGEIMATVEELKAKRKELKMTFEELSAKSGIPLRTLENIFHGVTKNPRVDTMYAIEKALSLSEEEPGYTEDEKEMFELIAQLTDEEAKQIWHFLEYLISKRQKK